MPAELKYPNGPEDHEGIIAYRDRLVELNQGYHREVEQFALRNIHYYMGNQWIKYDEGYRRYRQIALKKTTPRPVTNRVAPLVNQSRSNLIAFRPQISWQPMTDAPEDIAAASVADRINTVIEREAQVAALKSIVATWLVLTGNAFLVNNYDTSFDGGVVEIPSERCMGCQAVLTPLQIQEAGGACPMCGPQPDPMTGMMMPSQFGPAIDEMGQPITQRYPRGRFNTEVENVFTVWCDPEAFPIQTSPYFMVRRTRDRDWVARHYGEIAAEEARFDITEEPALLSSLAYTLTGVGRTFGGAGGRDEGRTTVDRVWVKPREDRAPNGIYAEIVGDKVYMARDYPYKDERQQPFLNVVHIGFDLIPGRLLYKTRVDDIIPKQDQRNRVESIIEQHSKRMAGSKWLLPKGIGISRISGEQGQILEYNALAGVPPPQMVHGDTIPPYLVQWTLQLDAEMDSIFGLFEVGRGEAPRGVSAASAMMLLDERAQQGQSALMDNWALGWTEWSRQNLNIWREYAEEERTLSLGVGQWATQKLNKASLQGGVDLDVELGQYRPHTGIGRRAAISQAVQMGAVSPFDPVERFKILQVLGVPEMMTDYKADVEHASRVLDKLVNGMPVRPPEPYENHMIALSVFRRFLLGEAFEALDPMQQEAIKAYAGLHYAFIQQSIQMGAGQTAPKPSGKDGPSSGTSEQANMTDGGQSAAEVQGATPDTFTGRIGGMP